MRVVIAGSSGPIGTAPREAYERDGHMVVRLARAELAASAPRRLDGADDAGIAVCQLRMGLVLSRRGGLLPPLLRLFRLPPSLHVLVEDVE